MSLTPHLTLTPLLIPSSRTPFTQVKLTQTPLSIPSPQNPLSQMIWPYLPPKTVPTPRWRNLVEMLLGWLNCEVSLVLPSSPGPSKSCGRIPCIFNTHLIRSLHFPWATGLLVQCIANPLSHASYTYRHSFMERSIRVSGENFWYVINIIPWHMHICLSQSVGTELCFGSIQTVLPRLFSLAPCVARITPRQSVPYSGLSRNPQHPVQIAMTYGHFCLLYSHGTRPSEFRPRFL